MRYTKSLPFCVCSVTSLVPKRYTPWPSLRILDRISRDIPSNASFNNKSTRLSTSPPCCDRTGLIGNNGGGVGRTGNRPIAGGAFNNSGTFGGPAESTICPGTVPATAGEAGSIFGVCACDSKDGTVDSGLGRGLSRALDSLGSVSKCRPKRCSRPNSVSRATVCCGQKKLPAGVLLSVSQLSNASAKRVGPSKCSHPASESVSDRPGNSCSRRRRSCSLRIGSWAMRLAVRVATSMLYFLSRDDNHISMTGPC
mmetsp:Transcript_5187/g.9795  ORF Transcript_5187/g.9795 Transcript_5187/m.9795 type:complete len:254 (-) Transcript_5187:1057-1818(-)